MPLNEKEVSADLEERQLADRVLDRWGGLRTSYQDFQDSSFEVFKVYRGEWYMTWPDGRVERVDPAVPNMVALAADDRAKQVAATPPQVKCYPEGPGDKAREKADKMERIVQAMLEKNNIRGGTIQRWAFDTMATGLSVCRVMPDFSKPPAERFPEYRRMDPQFSFPDPVFSAGPYLDSFIYSYEDYRRTIETRFGVELPWGDNEPQRQKRTAKVRVIEHYDEEWITVVIEELSNIPSKQTRREVIVQQRHRMGRCPVVLGVRPTMDGIYHGEFPSALGVLDYWNKLMTMVMDDAVRKVYPERVTYNVMNPEDYGPDANIQLEGPDGRYEYVNQGNQAFSNLQILRDVGNAVRTSTLFPPSRSGDPNESIISAAGINATQGQQTEDVRSIQRDVLAPMLEAATELALTGEEVWTPNVTKNINPGNGRYAESYVPSKDIAGYRKVRIEYGAASGLDPINQNVMVLQQLGANIIDRRTAMEMSPFVEDPQRVEKRQLKEQMTQAMLAGLQQQAANGQIDSFTLAIIDQALESDEVTLSEAIAALVPQAPLAGPSVAPQQTAASSPPVSPGLAGAAEGQSTPNNLPPLAQLLGPGGG